MSDASNSSIRAWLPWFLVAVGTLALAIFGIATLAERNPSVIEGPTVLPVAQTRFPQATITMTAFQSSQSSTSAPALPDLKGRALKVGTDPTYPPFESVNDQKEIVGFDVELINEICKRLNCKATFVAADLDTLFTAVQNQVHDLSVSGWTISDEHAKAVDFGLPYAPKPKVLLVRADDNRIQAIEDLKNSSFIVAAESDTTHLAIAKKLVADPNKQVKEYQELASAIQALVSKQADAVIVDIYGAFDPLDQSKGKLKTVGRTFGDEFLGFAFRKGNKELKEAFDAGLKSVVRDGTWSKLCDKWWKDIAPKPDCTGKTLPLGN